MKILVVARTRMKDSRRCIGAISENGKSLRLLSEEGTPHCEAKCPYRVGEWWDIEFTVPAGVEVPHKEDVWVTNKTLLGMCSDVGGYVRDNIEPWVGSISKLFDGLLQFTSHGSAYICERCGVPPQSTGFWIPDESLRLDSQGEYYLCPDGQIFRRIKYVGDATPEKAIPVGSLVRVSLARWWSPPDAAESRCYLQLSGSYLASRDRAADAHRIAERLARNAVEDLVRYDLIDKKYCSELQQKLMAGTIGVPEWDDILKSDT